MRVFEYSDYRQYMQAQIRALPRKGRGALLKLAEAASIHPSTLSQVLQGARNLTSDQAVAVADFFHLNARETHYFLLLVQHERAGTKKLRELLNSQLEHVRSDANQLAKRLPIERVLSLEEKAVFYSNWYFSACRILTSIQAYQTVDQLAERLKLPRGKAVEVVDYLLSHGLCVEKKGKLQIGPQSTHIEAGSPLVTRHHANWRIKAMERHPSLSSNDELAYTSPMSVSKGTALAIREELMRSIQRACEKVDGEKAPTELFCLNVDWFSV